MKALLKNFLLGSAQTHSTLLDWSYLLFRVYAGFSIAIGAGFAKVFHKINEKGSDSFDNLQFGVGDWFVQQVSDLGFTLISPTFWAYLAVYGEFIGGLLIAFGLFTRLNSLQLAFQFFVVSFIWYGDPAPIVGMYYQQLIFWSFVMTFGMGDGKYSLATLIQKMKSAPLLAKSAIAVMLVGVLCSTTQAQTTQERVSFVVKNPTLKNMSIEFKSYNAQHRKTAGYGYGLNALATHAVNLPAPVRIYATKNGKRDLILIVKKSDEGKTFSLNKEYDISREDYLAAAYDEMNEETDQLEATHRDKSIEQIAKEKGLKLVTFRVKGSSLLPKTTYVRYQLPWDTEKKPTGFTTSMSRFSTEKLSLPVGTKVYVCSDKYWERGVSYTEKLIVTVNEEKENYLFEF
ncbi:MAG: DoxX family protein [Spirosomataceae bacterium]